MAGINCESDDNQYNQNYSETVLSQLHATLLSDSGVNDQVGSLNPKDEYLILYITGLSYMSELSQGILQSNQHHFICFSQAVEAVINHI